MVASEGDNRSLYCKGNHLGFCGSADVCKICGNCIQGCNRNKIENNIAWKISHNFKEGLKDEQKNQYMYTCT